MGVCLETRDVAGADIDPAKQGSIVDEIPDAIVDFLKTEVFAAEDLTDEERATAP